MNKEREKYILEKLLKTRKVTVKELSKELYASEPSIRRDLAHLEKQNLIKRVHGGAVIESFNNSYQKIPFVMRELENYDAKSIIAKKAAELVNDGDIIMMDASSTAYAMIPYLSQKNNITVITSGVKTLMLLSEYNINSYSTGGKLLTSCLSLVGEDAVNTISKYNADIFFFSCRGISSDGFITDFSMDENFIRKKMHEHSKRSILLCAAEKLNKSYIHNLCSIDDIDSIISEIDFSRNMLKG